jgi:hypothetical protein
VGPWVDAVKVRFQAQLFFSGGGFEQLKKGNGLESAVTAGLCIGTHTTRTTASLILSML